MAYPIALSKNVLLSYGLVCTMSYYCDRSLRFSDLSQTQVILKECSVSSKIKEIEIWYSFPVSRVSGSKLNFEQTLL
jgi:hypothetical protein